MKTTNHLPTPPYKASSRPFFQEAVMGLCDGLTVPFVLVTGLSVVLSNTQWIAWIGLAEIALGSVVMGVGGYLSGKKEQEQYHTNFIASAAEKESWIQKENASALEMMRHIDLQDDLQQQALEDMEQERKQWMQQWAKAPHQPPTGIAYARKTGILIGSFYALGGLIPVIPYLLFTTPSLALPYSITATISCLIIFGYTKTKLTHGNAFWGAIRITLIACMAAAAAYGVAQIFIR